MARGRKASFAAKDINELLAMDTAAIRKYASQVRNVANARIKSLQKAGVAAASSAVRYYEKNKAKNLRSIKGKNARNELLHEAVMAQTFLANKLSTAEKIREKTAADVSFLQSHGLDITLNEPDKIKKFWGVVDRFRYSDDMKTGGFGRMYYDKYQQTGEMLDDISRIMSSDPSLSIDDIVDTLTDLYA